MTCFVFSGQGNEWVDMGRSLLKVPYFIKLFQSLNDPLQEVFGHCMEEQLLTLSEENLHNTQVIMPITYMIQMALVQAWKDLGVLPTKVIGHSMGEVAASVTSGFLTYQEGCLLIKAISDYLAQSRAKEGKMLLIKESEKQVLMWLKDYDQLWVSGINGDNWLTVSGLEQSIDSFFRWCANNRVYAKKLPASYAFHCPLSKLDYDAKTFEEKGLVNHDFSSRQSSLAHYSSLFGKSMADMSADYFAQLIQQKVSFSAALQQLLQEDKSCDFIEIAPDAVLSPFIKLAVRQYRKDMPLVLDSLSANESVERVFSENYLQLQANQYRGLQEPTFFVVDSPGLNRAEISFSEEKPDLGSDEQSSVLAVRKKLVAIWENCLNKENLDLKKTFIALGANSLSAVQAMQEIDAIFSVPITLQDLFDHPTIEALSIHLEACLTKQKV
jgi:acyl transferase domain-containing protein